MREEITGVMREIGKVIIGKETEKQIILAALLAGGHILMTDIPGVGKTSMALAISRTMELKARRMQFTPDVLPADVVGYHMIDREGEMTYREGVLDCHIFLADEINRTSAKTQSALLEVMEEGKFTVDGVTREAPKPFLVIATENPVGSIGTQMLPESQLDRFMISLSLGYPGHADEIQVLKDRRRNRPMERVKTVFSRERFMKIGGEIEDVFVSDEVYDYIVNLAEATRTHDWLEIGLSPRGTLAMTKISQSVAWMNGRDYVLPEDVCFSFPYVAAHRVVMNTKAKISKRDERELLDEIVKQVKLPAVRGNR